MIKKTLIATSFIFKSLFRFLTSVFFLFTADLNEKKNYFSFNSLENKLKIICLFIRFQQSYTYLM